MGKVITSVKNCIENICKRISTTLVENGEDPKSFQLQIMGYRNYNAPPDKILEYSGWSSDGTRLRDFLDNLEAKWGMHNEAIEIGFQHIMHNINNKDDEVSSVILIGDRAPNTREEVCTKRKKGDKFLGFGDCYDWDKHPLYNTPMYYEDQLAFFISNGIKIDAFYLDKQAKDSFELITKKTKGSCHYLDVRDVNKSTQTLIDLVCEKVLIAAGTDSQVNGTKLLKVYKKKFGHTK